MPHFTPHLRRPTCPLFPLSHKPGCQVRPSPDIQHSHKSSVQNCFLPPQKHLQTPPPPNPTRCREARPCLYLLKTGLLQRALLWDSWQKYTEAAIHPEQRCQGPKESPEIRPHHTNPLLPALAPCLSQDRLQNLGHDPQLHQWTCPPISTRTNKTEKKHSPYPQISNQVPP